MRRDENIGLDDVGPPVMVAYVIAPSVAPEDLQAVLHDCATELAQPIAAAPRASASQSPGSAPTGFCRESVI